MPDVKLLSNGNYHVMLTRSGGGYSRCGGVAVTRWQEDATCDHWGAFCYVRDRVSNDVWSTTLQPTLRRAEVFEAAFSAGRATFARRDHEIETQTEIAVSGEDDTELRRVRITNRSAVVRSIDVTSAAEIVLLAQATDSAHPAFNKLFVETEIDRELCAILATRRPSAPEEPTPWMFHLASVAAASDPELSYETDRMRFIGRGRSFADPRALDADAALSGTAGPVLDAMAAIRCAVTLTPEESVTVDLISGIAASREACVTLARKVRQPQSADRVLEDAATYSQATLERLGATDADALLYERLAASIVYAGASLRADPKVIAENQRGQSGLWGFGISADLAVVLLQITDAARMEPVRQLVQAHTYWRAHGVGADLVILCGGGAGDREPSLAEQITQSINTGGGADLLDKPGGIFVRDTAKLDDGDRTLLQAVARVVIADGDESLAAQIERRSGAAPVPRVPRACPKAVPKSSPTASAPSAGDLLGDNGLGGFSAAGREYVITSSAGKMTPAPWVNVLANPLFGTLVSESGSATTWSENAHEFRLTPWSNDPVGDANTEALYIRDDETGDFWSPTLLPTRGTSPYRTRHGFGYTIFEHSEHGIDSELCVYVAIDALVRFARLELRNRSNRSRRISVTGYVEWVLGDQRAKTSMQVVTDLDAQSGALFARNSFNTEFAGRTAFFDVDVGVADTTRTVSGDRSEFLGHAGTLASPAAMSQPQLSGGVGAALDPCAAIRVGFDLAADAEREITFRLGAGKTGDEARVLVQRWRGPDAAHAALDAVQQYWRHTLGAVQIATPDPILNALANGWLVYQVIGSRLWGRTGFYQSSGAFGFRDQLQDVMALVHAEPGLFREHLLRSASRQFVEGDVQHWWHPPSGRGVRTRCSDDYLWLPLATCRYVEASADLGVLDEPAHFLESRLLKEGEASNYDLPAMSAQAASLYEHCVRAIRHGLRFGAHGLPLMGSCDWNDGMNLVGAGGKGESVWLGFFLYAALTRFAPLARLRADLEFATLCDEQAAQLRVRIDESSWDGAWYRRAYFDDGAPLGSAGNTECQIDSIAQSWAVLSAATPPDRAQHAMDSVYRRLVDRDSRLIQLLDPPFDTSQPSPGYIQGYVPGVRENGGQYTHAAVWTAMAFAELGDAERAWELLRMLNPVTHGNSADRVATYRVEPYVIAGDVYAFAPHAGRGGWTWYTGSAGWMYRLIVESLLGLRRNGNKLRVSPLLFPAWKAFEVRYRFGRSVYDIECRQAEQTSEVVGTLDGNALSRPEFSLVDDGRRHAVIINVKRAPAPANGEAKCSSA